MCRTADDFFNLPPSFSHTLTAVLARVVNH
jgi:hypothetical protein